MRTKIISVENLSAIKAEVEKIETKKLLVVWDKTVFEKYGEVLNFTGDKYLTYQTPGGESCKSFSEYQKCIEFFLSQNVTRDSHLLVIGGGAASDMAGFVASTLLRGIEWSIIPTTLLSLIDSSIGGKTAINSKDTKNMVGNFHMPTNVIQCEQFLETLPELEKMSAYGEVLKYTFLDDFINVLTQSPYALKELIQVCTSYKNKIVQDDQKEKGIRTILNFGHTFGHVFEKKYQLPHGISVALGIKVILEKFCEGRLLDEYKIRCERLGLNLPKNVSIDKNDIKEFVSKDKKNEAGEMIKLVIINENNQPAIKKLSLEQILEQY